MQHFVTLHDDFVRNFTSLLFTSTFPKTVNSSYIWTHLYDFVCHSTSMLCIALCCSHAKANILANMKIYENLENVTIGQDKHDALSMHAKVLYILANPYEFLTNLAIPLQTAFRIACESLVNVSKYLKMPLQTLRMLANALQMKRLQSECLPILFLCNIFVSNNRVKLYYFIFV